MEKCNYDRPWQGQCPEPAIESGYCEKHSKEKCAHCGKQAVRGCDDAGSFVCGYPVCEDGCHKHKY